MPEVIERALIVDGTGRPGYVGDLRVEGDRIASVEPRDGAGSGLVLAPGFIDTHTHDDFAAVAPPRDGVQGAGRRDDVHRRQLRHGRGAVPGRRRSWRGPSTPAHELEPWEGYARLPRPHRRRRRRRSTSPRSSATAPCGARCWAWTTGRRHADELDAMRALVAEGMDAGCLGMSTGLIYEPGLLRHHRRARRPGRRWSPPPAASTRRTSATRATGCSTPSTRRSTSAAGPGCRS